MGDATQRASREAVTYDIAVNNTRLSARESRSVATRELFSIARVQAAARPCEKYNAATARKLGLLHPGAQGSHGGH
jgi:hypothetical protein